MTSGKNSKGSGRVDEQQMVGEETGGTGQYGSGVPRLGESF